MKKTLITWGYRICWRGDWIASAFARIWYRWWCPYPLRDDFRASACIAAGECGCDNDPRNPKATTP